MGEKKKDIHNFLYTRIQKLFKIIFKKSSYIYFSPNMTELIKKIKDFKTLFI